MPQSCVLLIGIDWLCRYIVRIHSMYSDAWTPVFIPTILIDSGLESITFHTLGVF